MEKLVTWGGKRLNAGRKKSSVGGRNLWIPADCLEAVLKILDNRIVKNSSVSLQDTQAMAKALPVSSLPLPSETIPPGQKITSLKQLDRLPKSVQRQLIKDHGSLFNAFSRGVWVQGKKVYVSGK